MAESIIEYLFNNASAVIALMGLIVAFIAMRFAAEQNRLSREHNRMSVKPRLETSTYHGDLVESDKSFSMKIEYFLKNTGLGPGIVTDFKITFEETVYEIRRNTDFIRLVNALLPEGVNNKLRSAFVGSNGSIKAGDNYQLLNLNIIFPKPIDRVTLNAKLQRIREITDNGVVEIKYKSLYGDEDVFKDCFNDDIVK